MANENGCFEFSDTEKIKIVVEGFYYQTDTITRVLQKEKRKEIIPLQRDDYALMIHFFSNSKIEDWKKRRAQLSEMIADDAVIFQVPKGEELEGMAIFNKEEFINKMTTPVGSLKNLKILKTEYRAGKIIRLRFVAE